MALCGVTETPQINCHSWPFSFRFFFRYPPLPSSFVLFFFLWFITKVPFMGWSSNPLPLACFWNHFMRNACPCLNVLIVLIDVPVFCPPGLLKSKKFQNMEKGPGIQLCADNPTSKHIWLQTYCSLTHQCNAAWRISPILLPLSVAERNVIWQTNVVTDSLSGGFYGPSVLLVHIPAPPTANAACNYTFSLSYTFKKKCVDSFVPHTVALWVCESN